MSHVYDNWGKLFEAVNKREQYNKLCYAESLSSSFSSVVSSDFPASTSSPRYSFDHSSADQLITQAAEDGNFQSFATASSANSRFDHVPKQSNMPTGSRFDKLFGAARRFVIPVRKHPGIHQSNFPQDISNEPGIQSGYSAPTVLEGKKEIPTVDVYALSFDELKEQTYNFGPKARIAKGFYGEVYLARLKSGKDVVLKMLDEVFESDSNDGFLTKVSMVSKFKHENLVEFLGFSIESHCRIVAYEFATRGTLHDFLHGRKGVKGARPHFVLDWMQRIRIAVNAARGLEYLHENGVIYREIRSSNVLLFNDFKAKIADINLSTKDPEDYRLSRNADPLYYRIPPDAPGYEYHAPDLFTNLGRFSMAGKWTPKCDVYSFGVVLLELLTGRKPLDDTVPRGRAKLVTWAVPKLSEDKVKDCVDPKLMGEYPPKAAAKLAAVADLCLQYEAEYRPDMKIIVRALQPLLKAPAAGI